MSDDNEKHGIVAYGHYCELTVIVSVLTSTTDDLQCFAVGYMSRLF